LTPACLTRRPKPDIYLGHVQIEFAVRERDLPPIVSFCVRIDSSLPDAALPQPEVEALTTELLAAAKEGARGSASVYLEFLPRLRDLASAHVDSLVCPRCSALAGLAP